MKKFSTFITEAVKSSAAEQAKKLGLTHAGYGRWMDKQGNVTHYSKQGKLLPVATDQPQAPNAGQQQQQPEPQAQQPAVPEAPGEVSKGPITITFGRFNPLLLGMKNLSTK